MDDELILLAAKFNAGKDLTKDELAQLVGHYQDTLRRIASVLTEMRGEV